MRIDTEYHFKIKNELTELKNLVRQFLEETMYVPFKTVYCNQDRVEELWEKLSDAIEEKNDR